MRLSIILLCLSFFILSCGPSQKSPSKFKSPEAFTESLPKVKPQKITEFSSVDSLFFQHLGYETIGMDDGSFVVGDRQGGFIVHVDSAGNFINQIARRGRGPEEVLDMTITQRPAGGILVYDQGNKKILLFDTDMKYEKEFSIKAPDGRYIKELYGLKKTDGFVANTGSGRWIENPEDSLEIKLANYNVVSKTYGNTKRYPIRQNAFFEILDGAVRGSAAIPYTSNRIIRYEPAEQRFWTMWTGTGEIAKLNSQFDTLQTFKIYLPKEDLSSAEIDTLEKQYQDAQWETLEKKLPDQKVAIDDMRVDEQGRFWLKLSYRSDVDQWLITDSEGKPQKIVQLPKGIMLTHVSKHHLGVRLGPGTFALYEPVE